MMKFKLTLTFCILDTVLIIACQPHFGGYNLPELHSTNLHESVSGLRNLRSTAFLPKCVCNVSTYIVPSTTVSIIASNFNIIHLQTRIIVVSQKY